MKEKLLKNQRKRKKIINDKNNNILNINLQLEFLIIFFS
jgi:hypothetical protein